MDEARRRRFDEALALWPRVYGFARQLTLDAASAEDLAQEAYLRLWSAKRELRMGEPLQPLLLTIVHNLARSGARRAPMGPLDEPLVDDRSVDPATASIASEEREIVGQVLASLSPLGRAALYLTDGLGCSYGEAARVLGTTDDVLRTTLHRARARVRDRLQRRLAERVDEERDRP